MSKQGRLPGKDQEGSPQVVMEPMSVHAFATTAIVVGTYRERQLERGQRILRGRRFVDTWVYKKPGWVLVAASAAPLK